MVNLIIESTHKPWMAVYLKILALFYLYGAAVHCANVFGFGELAWVDMPFSWKFGDISYGILDILAFIGLWLKSRWGLGIFGLIVISQLVLYVGFPQWFVLDREDQQDLWNLVMFHLVTLFIFFGLLLSKNTASPQK
ncbi:hypothetical protein PCC7424_0777 [Gloeothece citriformis PCC 7424]|uniref:DoxX family protein n=1 Tax=Gloeothece citriformis (strain PCC 7424) TaxID=65393 RepID=B7KG40_GLOC7|nr:hypothetical protein [Gloeothece citriformis]ACK69233.1 hypothetical protein PCC7424_0777 [Gloeothece citriformis PCC 7424]